LRVCANGTQIDKLNYSIKLLGSNITPSDPQGIFMQGPNHILLSDTSIGIPPEEHLTVGSSTLPKTYLDISKLGTFFTGDVGFTGGNVTILGNLGVTGDVSITGDVGITGDLIIVGDVGVTGNLDVTQTITTNTVNSDNVYIDNMYPLNTTIISITGDIGMTGNFGITGDMNIVGYTSITGDVGMTGDFSMVGNLGITGDANITGTLTVGAFQTQYIYVDTIFPFTGTQISMVGDIGITGGNFGFTGTDFYVDSLNNSILIGENTASLVGVNYATVSSNNTVDIISLVTTNILSSNTINIRTQTGTATEIKIEADYGDINIETQTDDINITSANDLNIVTINDGFIYSGGQFGITGGNILSLTAPDVYINGINDVFINAPIIGLTGGNIGITGDIFDVSVNNIIMNSSIDTNITASNFANLSGIQNVNVSTTFGYATLSSNFGFNYVSMTPTGSFDADINGSNISNSAGLNYSGNGAINIENFNDIFVKSLSTGTLGLQAVNGNVYISNDFAGNIYMRSFSDIGITGTDGVFIDTINPNAPINLTTIDGPINLTSNGTSNIELSTFTDILLRANLPGGTHVSNGTNEYILPTSNPTREYDVIQAIGLITSPQTTQWGQAKPFIKFDYGDYPLGSPIGIIGGSEIFLPVVSVSLASYINFGWGVNIPPYTWTVGENGWYEISIYIYTTTTGTIASSDMLLNIYVGAFINKTFNISEGTNHVSYILSMNTIAPAITISVENTSFFASTIIVQSWYINIKQLYFGLV